MRTFIIGSKSLSCVILDVLVRHGYDVLGVYVRDDEPGMRIWHEMGHRNLAEEARQHGVPVHYGMKVNSEASLKLLEALNLDLILSCFWSEIFKEPVLNLPKWGAFNFHTANLPLNRGSRPLPWALIKGESFAGVTLHRMMTGVDNGPIVAQRTFPITDQDTGKSLYEKAHAAGAELAEEVIPCFAKNAYQLRLQDEEQASYQPRGEPYGRMIDPFWGSQRRDRFIRAFDFHPFAGALAPPGPLKKAPKVYWMPNVTLRLARSEYSTSLTEGLLNNLKWTCFTDISTFSAKAFDLHAIGPVGETLNVKMDKTPASRNIVHRLKLLLDDLPNDQGLRPELETAEGVHTSYRSLDLLLRKKIPFISSRMLALKDNPDIIELQPHFHINGVLEIPSILMSDSVAEWEDQLRALQSKALTLSNNYQRDVFIGINVFGKYMKLFEALNWTREVFESDGMDFTTYSEVCQHFHSIYSDL